MSRTLATMITVTTYGTWLRGDRRGWVDSEGIVQPPNPILEAADRNRLTHDPYYFNPVDLPQIAEMMADSLTQRLNITLLAITAQTNHAHFVVGSTLVPIPEIVKRAKESVRWGLKPGRPIWGARYDKRFCFDAQAARARVRYVEKHDDLDDIDRAWGCEAVAQLSARFITDLDTYLAHSL